MDLNRLKFQRLNSSEEQSFPLTPTYHDHTSFSPVGYIQEPAQPRGWDSRSKDHSSQYTYVQNQATSDSGRRSTGDHRRSSRLSFIANPVSNFRIPTFAAPWQHEPLDAPPGHSHPSQTVRRYDPKSQGRRLLVNGLLQWLVIVVIVLAMAATLYGFSQAAWISKGSKYTFNALITLLSLSLGLALVTQLRSYAKLLSWRFMASQYWNLQDFELVMNCDSQTKVLKLFRAGRTPGKWLNTTQVLCIVSLTLVIGLQMVIGMLGLTYSVDTADGEFEWVKGNVSVVDLTDICQRSTCNGTSNDFVAQTAAANFYGIQGQDNTPEDATPGDIDLYYQVIYYDDDNKSWFYQFLDQSVVLDSSQNNIQGVSDRYIVQNASCTVLKVTEGGYSDNYTLGWVDEAGKRHDMNVTEITTLTTTYMSDGSTENYCGPRCTRILVLNTGDSSADDLVPPVLFGCNSTVGQVQYSGPNQCSNETACSVTDDLARILAGSIGWSGTYWYDDEHSLQFKNYPPGSPWSWYDEDSDVEVITPQTDPAVVATNIAMFSTNAISAMDISGPRVTMLGRSPTSASQLTVEWQYAIPILVVIPGVQLVVLFIVWFWARGAVILDGSYLSTARMLLPVVEKLHGHGGALTGDEIAKALGNFRIVYGARAPAGHRDRGSYDPEGRDPEWRLGIISEREGFGETPEEGWNSTKRFPVGKYE